MDSFTVLFAGGGTGGHLIPGLSVATELRRRFPECRLVFVGTHGQLERDIVGDRGFEFVSLPTVKWYGSPLNAPAWAVRSTGGLLAARKVLARVRPDLVASLGGHAAFAPSVAAVLGDVPLVLMEQNALPGKVNRFLSVWAEEVYVPWSDMERYFARADRVHVTGNPIRTELIGRRIRGAAWRFGLSPRKATLLVVGGSQGSQAINRAVIASLPRLEAEASWLQILHSAGKTGYEETLRAYEGYRIQAAVYPFIDDMAAAYTVADLALCRAGGTTLAELSAVGVPAVLVPLPIAANNHQRRNASMAAGGGAALIVDQADLTADRLPGLLLSLLRNASCLARMRGSSLRLGRPDAARYVADRIVGVLHDNGFRETPSVATSALQRL